MSKERQKAMMWFIKLMFELAASTVHEMMKTTEGNVVLTDAAARAEDADAKNRLTRGPSAKPAQMFAAEFVTRALGGTMNGIVDGADRGGE